MLGTGKEQREICAPTIDTMPLVSTCALIARLTHQVQNTHAGIIVMHDAALRRLADQLL